MDDCGSKHNMTPAGKPAWVGRLASVAALGLVALVFLPQLTPMPQLSGERMTLAWALLTGVLTGFHCVSMCGGLVLSWSTRPGSGPGAYLSYGLGKTAAYTLGGALCGLLGQALSFTPQLRGWVGLAAGIVLILYGVAPLLKRSARAAQLALPCQGCGGRASRLHRPGSHPLHLGLLNGLMVVCGPLQAMYLAAAGTASPSMGAGLLFCFGIGTLPVLLSFAAASSLVGRRLRFDMARLGALTMCLFGVLMLQRGWALAGVARSWSDPETLDRPVSGEAQVLHMTVDRSGYRPSRFQIEAGRPVRWVIRVEERTTCNERLIWRGQEYPLHEGENLIAFQAGKPGTLGFSCWMGMIRGQIQVVAK